MCEPCALGYDPTVTHVVARCLKAGDGGSLAWAGSGSMVLLDGLNMRDHRLCTHKQRHSAAFAPCLRDTLHNKVVCRVPPLHTLNVCTPSDSCQASPLIESLQTHGLYNPSRLLARIGTVVCIEQGPHDLTHR